MKKMFAILLTISVLSNSLHIDFKDIENISVLLNHAKFHQEKYGTTFTEFLFSHYIEQDIATNQEHKEHQNLPFKQGAAHFNHLVPVLDLLSHNYELNSPKIIFSKTHFYYEESASNFEKPAIFQPPKFS